MTLGAYSKRLSNIERLNKETSFAIQSDLNLNYTQTWALSQNLLAAFGTPLFSWEKKTMASLGSARELIKWCCCSSTPCVSPSPSCQEHFHFNWPWQGVLARISDRPFARKGWQSRDGWLFCPCKHQVQRGQLCNSSEHLCPKDQQGPSPDQKKWLQDFIILHTRQEAVFQTWYWIWQQEPW